jgi:hypothetical protein
VTIATPPHATWFQDARRIIDITEKTPGLPIPHISPARASFDYRHIVHAEAARESVTRAAADLGEAFKVTFSPRTETAGDGTPRYLLEALLLSGITLVIISRVDAADEGDDAGARVPELAGVAA